MKTKKTLSKRIKVTGKGKLMKKHSSTGHLKRKWDAEDSYEKQGYERVPKTHRRKFKNMISKV